MESLNFHNIKLEKSNGKKRQTMFFRLIEFCIFLAIISRFSIQLPLSTDYVGVTLVSPRFVFVLVNTIVIILFFKSGHSSAINDSTDNVKMDLYDEYTQKYSMNNEQSKKQSISVEEANCEQSKKQSISVEENNCEQSKKQSNLAERRLEKRIHRSHSVNSLCLGRDEKKSRKRMMRSATVGCLKNIDAESVKPAMTTTSDGLSSVEFRKTVEAFIARHQRLVKEEEFSIST
ncbi:hypothetical protein EJD97_025130 [Solanum chilense]|uniref:DUF4408 domain-containing protein n=1 Tax=Solanum chilense TaxID=4083 RepID=A0A6N2CDQ8_SOLCI|nr:hypothetical protein EJD97_025130 [Solanum chilense]